MRDRRWQIACAVAACVFVVDRVTKVAVERSMALEQTIEITPFFALTYVRNPGAAFGLFSTVPSPLRVPLLLAVTLVAFWVLFGYLRDTPAHQRGMIAALGGVLGGALGNLYCRVRFGEVIDFFHLHWGDLSWPMFNVADSAITVGVVFLLATSLFETRKTAEPPVRSERRPSP